MLRALVFIAALAFALPAFAQRGGRQGEAEVSDLLNEARQAYDNFELDAADDSLQRALAAGRRAGVRGRVMAEVHIQIGLVISIRDKDRARTTEAFREALREDPEVRLDRNVATPTLEGMFAEAMRDVGANDRAEVAPSRGGSDTLDDAITHRPVKRAPAKKNLAVEVRVTPELADRMYKAYLYFRSEKAESVQRIVMSEQGDRTYVARIPAQWVRGEQIAYYVLVEDRDGRPIASVRGPESPYKVELENFASGASLTGVEGEEPAEGDEEVDEDSTRFGRRRVFSLGLSLGTGAGVITENATPENQPTAKVSGGFAPAPFHTMIEADFWVTPRFALGGFARVQIVEFTHAEGGRLKFVLLDSGANQLTARVGGGFGKVRHLVQLGSLLDTTLEGPYFWTAGLGYAYNFSKTVALTVMPDFYHLIGDSPSFHFDLGLGVQLSF